MTLEYRPATPDDVPECIRLRGRTRENAVSEERLRAAGITAESWGNDIQSGALPGFVCCSGGDIAGYCFGEVASGEVVVLSLLPAFEDQGIGKRLLGLVVELLRTFGHARLFLGCSSDPAVRSHGFYRHLGWSSTGAVDRFGDEVLELRV